MSSFHNNDDDIESSSGSELCEEEFLAYQTLKPESRKRNQRSKINKRDNNFYSKIRVKKDGKDKSNYALDSESDGGGPNSNKAQKNVNSKNIRQLEETVIELTERCKKLGIYVGDPATKEQSSKENDNEKDSTEDEDNKSNPNDNSITTNQCVAVYCHAKFSKQRVGSGTGNTKCHKKNSKKQQMVALGNMVQHLEKLLDEHQNQHPDKKQGGKRSSQNKGHNFDALKFVYQCILLIDMF